MMKKTLSLFIILAFVFSNLLHATWYETMSTPKAIIIYTIITSYVNNAANFVWAFRWNKHFEGKISDEDNAKIQEAGGLSAAVSGFVFTTFGAIAAYLTAKHVSEMSQTRQNSNLSESMISL